jgi:hypothetical protein
MVADAAFRFLQLSGANFFDFDTWVRGATDAVWLLANAAMAGAKVAVIIPKAAAALNAMICHVGRLMCTISLLQIV